MTTPNTPSPHVTFDPALAAVVITDLTVRDPSVVSEARRWSTGSRGECAADAALAGVDLSGFVAQALSVGAGAIAAAGNAQDTFDLEQLVSDVGERTAASSRQAADLTGKAVLEATKAMTAASELAKTAITDAEQATRSGFEQTMSTAQNQLRAELQRLLGGDKPELVERLQPLLQKFGADLDAKVSAQTTELLAKAARQFDPSDPTSPMAKHAAGLAEQQKGLTQTLAANHESLTTKVEALVAAVTAASAAQQATSRFASVTPIKGATYADAVHVVMHGIASGLGDEYRDTGSVAGRISRNKKGDGVLSVADLSTRVVLEMTDSPRAHWNEYLDEAERNRDAAASLGLVRDATQNAGQSIRVLGPRRIVMAFDPACDHPDLLRTVIVLLRTAARAATSRAGAAELATAGEKLAEAIALLARLDDVQKTASAIQKSAAKIGNDVGGFVTGIERLLTQAQSALGDVEAQAVSPSQAAPSESGAA